MSYDIEWVADKTHPYPVFRGWVAYLNGQVVGKVYTDGGAWFGTQSIGAGSPHLAARALVRYFETSTP